MKHKKRNNKQVGYDIVGEYCGRDANGAFHCVCGKCKRKGVFTQALKIEFKEDLDVVTEKIKKFKEAGEIIFPKELER